MVELWFKFVLWVSTPFAYLATYIAINWFGAGVEGVMMTTAATVGVVFVVVTLAAVACLIALAYLSKIIVTVGLPTTAAKRKMLEEYLDQELHKIKSGNK